MRAGGGQPLDAALDETRCYAWKRALSVQTWRCMRPRTICHKTLAVGLVASVALLVAAAPGAAQSVQLTPFGGQTFTAPYYATGGPGDPSRVFVVEGAG